MAYIRAFHAKSWNNIFYSICYALHSMGSREEKIIIIKKVYRHKHNCNSTCITIKLEFGALWLWNRFKTSLLIVLHVESDMENVSCASNRGYHRDHKCCCCFFWKFCFFWFVLHTFGKWNSIDCSNGHTHQPLHLKLLKQNRDVIQHIV